MVRRCEEDFCLQRMRNILMRGKFLSVVERDGVHEIVDIPRSRHNPKILWVDDAKIVGDRITEVWPFPGRDRDTARVTLGQGLAVSAFPRCVPV